MGQEMTDMMFYICIAFIPLIMLLVICIALMGKLTDIVSDEDA